MTWPRFWWGLAAGAAAGAITYAIAPVREYAPFVALVVFVLIWLGEYVGD
ncbi:hypothetical protein ACFV27_00645 [Streptomyces antimycoticus]